MSEEDVPRTRPGPDGQDKELTGEQLFATLYADLRRMADRELVRNRGMTVSPTTLVHEAYVKLSGRDGVKFADRGKFLGYAARAMRSLLIDLARRRQALKRGSGFHITQISTQVGDEVADSGELTQLSEALDENGLVRYSLHLPGLDSTLSGACRCRTAIISGASKLNQTRTEIFFTAKG